MVSADIIQRAWRRVDIKLNIDGGMHVLRWRRTLFADQVLFDDRVVATSRGFFGRDTSFGLAMRAEDDAEIRLLLTVDPANDAWDMSGEMRPRGVRLETADKALIAFGSLGATRAEAFRDVFDRAVRSLGLA